MVVSTYIAPTKDSDDKNNNNNDDDDDLALVYSILSTDDILHMYIVCTYTTLHVQIIKLGLHTFASSRTRRMTLASCTAPQIADHSRKVAPITICVSSL